MDRGAWRATVHGVTKSRTQLTAHSTCDFIHFKTHQTSHLKLKIFLFHKRKWRWKSLSHVPLLATPYSPWNSPGQNTGVGSLSLHQGSSQPKDQTQVSLIAGRFFTIWATREVHVTYVFKYNLHICCSSQSYSSLLASRVSMLSIFSLRWYYLSAAQTFHICLGGGGGGETDNERK